MIDIAPILNVSFVDSLIGYLEVRCWAFEKLCSSPIGSNLIDLKMHHHLYFTNLFSATELVRDHLGENTLRKAFEQDVQNGFAASGDWLYARELRNSIIHRGLDLTAQGVQQGQYIFAATPPVVFNKDGRIGYACTFPLLVDLATACNTATNGAILAVVEREDLLDPRAHILERTQALEITDDAVNVPEWVGSLAEKALEAFDYEAMSMKLAQFRVDRLQSLLGRGQRR